MAGIQHVLRYVKERAVTPFTLIGSLTSAAAAAFVWLLIPFAVPIIAF